ncbi:YfdQ family protein [Streptomyces sp. rh34]|uniref:YfdQ family protein n=1 Tax=Streptomyces sp. rh34 TaxID=2034272 RepID=UPI00211D9F5D|nr:YfdQ family protein [Streptomyces sp. rh34]
MTDIQPVIDTALRSAPPAELTPGKVYAFHTPTGVHQVDLTGPAAAPTRKTGTTTVRDAASFHAYFEKHADIDTEVYADSDRLTITAVLDAHQADAPRFGGHVLRLSLRETEAWKQWATLDGRLLGQEQFAEFLEDHLPELLEPSAAEMLEIAQSIQGATKAEFQSSTRLSSGQRQFQFVETTTAKAGQKGQLTIPETFTIGLVPFDGSEGYKLTARFRYRVGRDGELTLGYKLERPGDIRAKAFQDVVTAIGEHIDQPVMNGTPA